MSFNRQDWIKTVANVAPSLAHALGGPLAGAAVKALSDATLGRQDGSVDEVARALQTNSPDVALKIKEAEYKFKMDMERAGVDLERIAADDRNSARDREVSTGDNTPSILAYSVTVGFFATLWYAFGYGMPEHGGEALLIMLGALGTAWAGVISYYFGSSAGSKSKDALLHQSRPA